MAKFILEFTRFSILTFMADTARRDTIIAPAQMDQVRSDPSATPVAMSTRCLHTRMKAMLRATFTVPRSTLAVSCQRAPLEWTYSHLTYLRAFFI